MTAIIKRVEVTTTELRSVLVCDGPACGNEVMADPGSRHFPPAWYAVRLPFKSDSEDTLHFCGLACLQAWAAQATLQAVYADRQGA